MTENFRGTETTGQHYDITATTATVNLLANTGSNQQATCTVPITDDWTQENEETFHIVINENAL